MEGKQLVTQYPVEDKSYTLAAKLQCSRYRTGLGKQPRDKPYITEKGFKTKSGNKGLATPIGKA